MNIFINMKNTVVLLLLSTIAYSSLVDSKVRIDIVGKKAKAISVAIVPLRVLNLCLSLFMKLLRTICVCPASLNQSIQIDF